MSAPLFTPEALAALGVPGVAERWAAVQQRLHPPMAALAERIAAAAAADLPGQWPLYELSFKHQRYLHRGRGQRDPITDYWLGLDRPPRGAGVLVAVSGAERAVLVGLQLWGRRKPDLARLWAAARAVWAPLAERVGRAGQARFAGAAPADPAAPGAWVERYLESRGASYLWAGFLYPWAALPDDLEARLVADARELLRLNEALMEQAEAELAAPARLRERPADYAPPGAPDIETIAERVRARGLRIADLTLRAYHVALQTRPLALLAGISGTGKTRLTRLYADALYGIAPGQENPHYLAVAVQPDWHSARDLLGYYNALSGSYQPTPFLRFLLAAAADPQQPYFVCLDELNLARPEYFLAPILSALETEEGLIDLGAPAAEVPMAGGGTLRSPLRLPLNLRLIGTLNVDESSYALSDRLLDRANLIELTDVDLEAFRAGYAGPVDPLAWQVIAGAHAAMSGAGLPFGYRTIGEMLRFVERAAGMLSPAQAIDLQLKQKLLPRLRGEDSPRLRRALDELVALAAGPPELPESAARLRRMRERLAREGYTDFYG